MELQNKLGLRPPQVPKLDQGDEGKRSLDLFIKDDKSSLRIWKSDPSCYCVCSCFCSINIKCSFYEPSEDIFCQVRTFWLGSGLSRELRRQCVMSIKVLTKTEVLRCVRMV